MQQIWNKGAAVWLCVLLAMVVGCGGQVITPEYRYYEYDRNKRFTAAVPGIVDNPTQIVDDQTYDVNLLLWSGGNLEQEDLLLLDGGGNVLFPTEYSSGYGSVAEVSANGVAQLRLYSSPGNVTFANYNFVGLPPTHFISYVEVIGNGDFQAWRDDGFFFGIRQGGEESFSWTGPVGGANNWIFSYSLHVSEDYQGGAPSFAIAVADGDRLRISEVRVVVSRVGDHLRRSNLEDPHRIWPYTANEFFNPGKVHHYYNGTYHRDGRDGTYWDDDFSSYGTRDYSDNYSPQSYSQWQRDLDYSYQYDSYDLWDDAYGELNNIWDEVDNLNNELRYLEQEIAEKEGQVPDPAPTTFYAPGVQPAVTPGPVAPTQGPTQGLKSVPVL